MTQYRNSKDMELGPQKSIDKKKRKPRGIVLPSVSDGLLASVANQIVRIKDRRERSRYVREALLPSNTHIYTTVLRPGSMERILKARRRNQIDSYAEWNADELVYMVEMCAHDRIKIKTPSSIYAEIAFLMPQNHNAAQNILQLSAVFAECSVVDQHELDIESFLDLSTTCILNMPNKLLRKTLAKLPIVYAVLNSAYPRFTHELVMKTMYNIVKKEVALKTNVAASDVETIHTNMKAVYYRMLAMADQEHLRTRDVVAENPDHALCIEIEGIARDLGLRIAHVTRKRVEKWVDQKVFPEHFRPKSRDITYAAFKKTHTENLPVGYIVLKGKLVGIDSRNRVISFKSLAHAEIEDSGVYGWRLKPTLEMVGLDAPAVYVRYLQVLFPGHGIGPLLMLYAMAKISEARCADVVALEDASDKLPSGRNFYIDTMRFFDIEKKLLEHKLSVLNVHKYVAITNLREKLNDANYVTSVLQGLASERRQDIPNHKLYFNRFNYAQRDQAIAECCKNIRVVVKSIEQPPKKEPQLADLVIPQKQHASTYSNSPEY